MIINADGTRNSENREFKMSQLLIFNSVITHKNVKLTGSVTSNYIHYILKIMTFSKYKKKFSVMNFITLYMRDIILTFMQKFNVTSFIRALGCHFRFHIVQHEYVFER